MSELLADISIALREAQDVAARIQIKLRQHDDQALAREAAQIQKQLDTLRKEFRTMQELPAARAGEIIEQLREMLMRCRGALQALHPPLVQAIAATLRGAEE